MRELSSLGPFNRAFKAETGVDPTLHPAAKARLWWAAEDAKKRLSFEPSVMVREEALLEHEGRLLNREYELTRDELQDLVRTLVREGALTGVHDASSGGLGVALAELTCRSGLGLRVDAPLTAAQLFSESPSRVVAAVPASEAASLVARAEAAGVAAVVLGVAGGDRLVIADLVDLPADEVITTWRDRLPVALGAGTTQA